MFKTTLKYTRTKYAEFSHTFKRDATLELRTDNICIPSTAPVSRVGEQDSETHVDIGVLSSTFMSLACH